MCKLCKEVEEEGLFTNFKTLIPYKNRIRDLYENRKNSLCDSCISCGVGTTSVFMLPKYYVSCNMVFGNLIDDYKKYASKIERLKNKVISFDYYVSEKSNNFLMDEQEFEKFCYFKIPQHLNKNDSSRGKYLLHAIKLLANCNQIEDKYKNTMEAFIALNYLTSIVGSCIFTNSVINNSIYLPDLNIYKLFLNGALEYIKDDN